MSRRAPGASWTPRSQTAPFSSPTATLPSDRTPKRNRPLADVIRSSPERLWLTPSVSLMSSPSSDPRRTLRRAPDNRAGPPSARAGDQPGDQPGNQPQPQPPPQQPPPPAGIGARPPLRPPTATVGSSLTV